MYDFVAIENLGTNIAYSLPINAMTDLCDGI